MPADTEGTGGSFGPTSRPDSSGTRAPLAEALEVAMVEPVPMSYEQMRLAHADSVLAALAARGVVLVTVEGLAGALRDLAALAPAGTEEPKP